jgi:hypothetical protein
MRLGLLVLTMASGDPALALSFSRRLAEIEPHHRAAMYTQVAVLSATGKQNEAERLAETWCALHPSDQKMRNRAIQVPQQPRVWGSWPPVLLGSDASLDLAVNLLQNQ